MRKNIVYLALPFVFLAACNRSSRVEREQRQYDVVQEGAAVAGNSTALGAVTVPPLTGTNADTTTAFTLDPRLSTAQPLQEPTIASGMPEPAYGSSPSSDPSRSTGSTAPRPSTSQPPTREPVRQEPAPTTRPRTEPATPPSSTSPPPPEPTDPAPPPPTDTTAPSTDTAPPPAPREKPSPTPPPTTTDTAPPPTTTDTTDTSGTH